MFEVGKFYIIHERFDGTKRSHKVEVLDWQQPWLKYRKPFDAAEVILNTANSTFHSAELIDPPAPQGEIADKPKKENKWAKRRVVGPMAV